jgi:hypothetical protein
MIGMATHTYRGKPSNVQRGTSVKTILRPSTIAAMVALPLILAACGTDDGASTAQANSDPFYDGRSIEVIVPVSAGGGTDAQGRLVATKLQECLEGGPSVQVVNREGGGGIVGGNEFALQREHNGEHLIMMGPSTLLPWILGDSAVEYDLAEMVPLWASPMPHVASFAPSTGVQTVEDLANPDEQIVFGGTSPTGADLPAMVGLEAVGILDSMKVIFGYEGGSALAAAFDAGEVNMNRRPSGTFMRLDADAYKSGEKVVVYTHGMPDGDGNLVRDPLFPDEPHLGEVYETLNGATPSGEAWDAYMLLTNVLVTGGYSFWTHADAPPEAIEELQEGMACVIEDEAYQEQKVELVGPYDEITGEEVREWGNSLDDLEEESLQWIRDFVASEYGVKFD